MCEPSQDSAILFEPWLKNVQWAYLQMVPVNDLKSLLEKIPLNIKNQERLYGSLFGDPYVLKYPVAPSYCYKVVKLLIDLAENSQEEIFEPLLELVLNSITVKDDLARQESHLTYGLINDAKLCTTRVVYPSNEVGLIPWEAGYFLAEYALANPNMFRGKRILELGSGIGLTGMFIAAKCSPEEILLTDHIDEVLTNLRYNVRINEEEGHICEGKVKVAHLDWEEESSLQHQFDMILAADCIYDPDYIPALVRLVKTCLSLAKPNSRAVFATTKRNEKTFETFKNAMNDADFDWSDESAKVVHLETLFAPSCSVMLNRNPKREDITLYVAKLRLDLAE